MVRLHTNFPHHRAGVIRLLACDDDPKAVAEALLRWQACKFEHAAAQCGLCVTALRSHADWEASPQGRAVSDLPVQIDRVGTAPRRPLAPGRAPARGRTGA